MAFLLHICTVDDRCRQYPHQLLHDRRELTERATQVRQRDPEWVALLLWRAEFLNVLWLHVRQGEFGLDLAIQHIDLAEDLIGERSYDVAPTEVLRLVVDSGCSAYDPHYAALAQQLDVSLVTHDGEVLEAFPETAVHPDDFIGQQ